MNGFSYKKLWQEEQAKTAALSAEVARLQALVRLGPDGNARELERTRVIVDLAGIARHMQVNRYTPQQWRQRGHLPPVDFPEIKEPLWYASTIIDGFCVPSRRVWYTNPERCNEADEELLIPG